MKVDLTTDPTQDSRDSFGRLLAYANVPAGERGVGIPGYDLSRNQIVSGWSRAYTLERRVRRYGRYIAAEREARTEGRGVWGLCGGDFHSEQ